MQHSHYLALWILILFVVSACSSLRKAPSDGPPPVVYRPAAQSSTDPIPRTEPLSKYGNPSSYVVFGKRYYTLSSSHGFVQRGIASWYGKKFHGRRTSSGEIYDMYGMTAAHTQLPLPTYVQVTNLKNGKQVILRVNDRGPFHGNRVIDLSHTAATKLGIIKEGTGLVEVRAIDTRNYRLVQNQVENSSLNTIMKMESATVAESIYEEQLDVTPKINPDMIDEQVAYVDDDSTIFDLDATTVSNSGPQIFLQVGAFGERENANQLKNQLSGLSLGEVTISSIIKNSKQLHRVRIGPLTTVQSADNTVAELNSMGMNDYQIVIE